MSGRNRQGDWGDFPDRARQPLGPGAARPRKGYGYQQLGARMPGQPPGKPNGGGRSRFVTIVVLVVAAVIVAIGGLVASSGSSGSDSTVSLSLLPFPQNTSTTLGQ
jgi:hypothetical protein